MDAVAALTRHGGIASTSELVGLTSRKRVRRAVAAGRIVHVSRSRYALPSQDEAQAVADSALRSGEVSREKLEAALAADASAAVRRVVAHASPLAANPFESVLHAILIEAGIPVVPQWATTLGGVTYHPDLADPIHGIAIEANSFAHHAGKADHDQDCVRHNALVTAGWIVLRFTWEQVMVSPGEVVATVRAALALRHAA